MGRPSGPYETMSSVPMEGGVGKGVKGDQAMEPRQRMANMFATTDQADYYEEYEVDDDEDDDDDLDEMRYPSVASSSKGSGPQTLICAEMKDSAAGALTSAIELNKFGGMIKKLKQKQRQRRDPSGSGSILLSPFASFDNGNAPSSSTSSTANSSLMMGHVSLDNNGNSLIHHYDTSALPSSSSSSSNGNCCSQAYEGKYPGTTSAPMGASNIQPSQCIVKMKLYDQYKAVGLAEMGDGFDGPFIPEECV